MPEQGEEFKGDAVVSGWGTLSPGGATPDELRYVTVPLVDDASKYNLFMCFHHSSFTNFIYLLQLAKTITHPTRSPAP